LVEISVVVGYFLQAKVGVSLLA